jgi:hypothetical protein
MITAMIQLEGSRVTCLASFTITAASWRHQARHEWLLTPPPVR